MRVRAPETPEIHIAYPKASNWMGCKLLGATFKAFALKITKIQSILILSREAFLGRNAGLQKPPHGPCVYTPRVV